MKKSADSKLEFRCTGDLWGAIYVKPGESAYDKADKDFTHSFLSVEINNAISSEDGVVEAGTVHDKQFVYFRVARIPGYLNTAAISANDDKSKSLVLMTAFPEISTDEYLKAELLEIYEYSGGFEARLQIRVKTDSNFFEQENTFWIFDTRYVINKDTYKVGGTYKFHVGAIVTDIKHRPDNERTMEMSPDTVEKVKEAFAKSGEPILDDSEGWRIVTDDLFTINPMFDDNPEAFYCKERFNGLLGKELYHPDIPKEFMSYIFHITSHVVDSKPGYSVPAYVSHATFLLSGDNGGNIFKEGDPVDIKGIMQGYLVSTQ